MLKEKSARPSRQEVAAPTSLSDASILPAYPNVGNPKDAGLALGVPESTIRQLCRTKELRAFKCGTHWRIPKAWLLEFIERGGCLDAQLTGEQGGDLSCRTL